MAKLSLRDQPSHQLLQIFWALTHRPQQWQRRGAGPTRLGQVLATAVGLLVMTHLPGAAAPTPAVSAPGAQSPPDLRLKQDSAAPVVPPLPETIPDPISPDETGIIGLTPALNDNLGIGHLRPAESDLTDTDEAAGAGWLQGVTLPIYPSPESSHWGWMVKGWLIPNDASPLAIGRDAAFSMVQLEGQTYAFPVLEMRPDGWFRFQYTPAGAAWAHISHLDLGTVPLTIETWEASMKDAAQVEFRRPGLSQPMRLAPNTAAPLQALVGPNSIIQPLDLEGDWLRVRVTQPAQGCIPLPGASTAEGWVRWRSETDMPLVWFSGDDC